MKTFGRKVGLANVGGSHSKPYGRGLNRSTSLSDHFAGALVGVKLPAGAAPGAGANFALNALPPAVLLRSSIIAYHGLVLRRSTIGAGRSFMLRARLKGPWKRILPFLSSRSNSSS